MKLYVGITDYDWFNLHSSKTTIEEVNFWRPSARMGFNVLKWGEPFLFKLHSPLNFIVGGGFFTKFVRLPVSLAWEAFGEANGLASKVICRVITALPSDVRRRLCPAARLEVIQWGLRPETHFAEELLTYKRGRSPTSKYRAYGGAEPPPHIGRLSRDENDF